MIEKKYEWISIEISIIQLKYNWTIRRMNRKLDCNWSYRNINWEYDHLIIDAYILNTEWNSK